MKLRKYAVTLDESQLIHLDNLLVDVIKANRHHMGEHADRYVAMVEGLRTAINYENRKEVK